VETRLACGRENTDYSSTLIVKFYPFVSSALLTAENICN